MSANLMLCRYAAEVDGRLFISDGNLDSAPPKGSDFEWYLAGVFHVPAESVKEGDSGFLLVINESGKIVSKAPRGRLDLAFTGDPADEQYLKGSLCIRLPSVDMLPPGLYAWQLRFPRWRQSVPFRVLDDVDTTGEEAASEEERAGNLPAKGASS